LHIAKVVVIYLGQELPPASCGLPEGQRAASSPLLGLAPGGVCHATGVTTCPVGSYPTFSPLPYDIS